MINRFCGSVRHDAIASDASLWAHCISPGWCEWDEEEIVESGHCQMCGSTISRTITRPSELPAVALLDDFFPLVESPAVEQQPAA